MSTPATADPTDPGSALAQAPTAARTPASFAARHADYVALLASHTGVEDDAWAMPLVVHLPRGLKPQRSLAWEAVAQATAQVCLDPRVTSDPQWAHAFTMWLGQRMRKIARRGRASAWERAQTVPGVSVRIDATVPAAAPAEARACIPFPVAKTDPLIAKLQIGGTDLPADAPPAPPAGLPVIWLNGELEMSFGKACAQVSHGMMVLLAAIDADLAELWAARGFPIAVRVATPAEFAALRTPPPAGVQREIIDAGHTEIAPGSRTVIVRWDDLGQARAVLADEATQCGDRPVAVGGLPHRGE